MGDRWKFSGRSSAQCCHGGDPWKYDCELCAASRLDESALYKEQTTGRIYSGAALMHGGMPLPAEFGEYRAYQYHFVRE